MKKYTFLDVVPERWLDKVTGGGDPDLRGSSCASGNTGGGCTKDPRSACNKDKPGGGGGGRERGKNC